MTDIINLNSIRSDNCDCNKPKPKEHSCGCHNHNNNSQPCYLAVNLGDLYFKVKNLFGELKSEWQRTEARSNLGIVDILGLELTKESLESGGTNEWTMYTSKGGLKNDYKFYVYNGQKGDSASVEVVKTNTVDSDKDASVENVSGSDQHVKLVFDIPRGKTGETGEKGDKGDRGKSAYELAVDNGFYGDLEAWLKSLKGDPGDDNSVTDVSLILPIGIAQPEDAYIWRITLKNGQKFDFWVPKNVGGGSTLKVPTIMYKKIHYDYTPSESTLSIELENLQIEVNRNNQGRSVAELELAGWTTYAGTVRENDFVFMASSVITDEIPGLWQVVRLTPLSGKDGTSGEGTRGDFKSTAFTRTNNDISKILPQGGTYDTPIPDVANGITWTDEIPLEIDNQFTVIWATTCTFHGDGTSTGWSLPKRMSDTSTYDVAFSSIEKNPGNPTSHPGNWHNPSETGIDWSLMIWRAERYRNSQLDQWSNWVILRIKGEKGDPGTSGESGQGLAGPVIRMRGTWISTAGRGNSGDPECYKNESNELPELNIIRFIDVVFYNGSYWMVRPGITCASPGVSPESNTDQWVKATQFDFAYINTLISDYISTNYLDAEEIRIHDRAYDSNNVLTQDVIVAGMTSGKSKNGLEENLAGSVRIWAGSNVDTINKNVGKYTLNLADAKFKVHSDGSLFASKAEIEGTVQANTLRLGELKNGNGTFKLADNDNTITLPDLPGNLTQMFYLLTNNGYAPDIKPNTNDNILTPSGTLVTSSNTYQTSKNKLYQCFGINHTWYIVELDIWAASSVVDEEPLAGIRLITLIPTDEWTPPLDGENAQNLWFLQTQNIKGILIVELFNNTNNNQVIRVPKIDVTVRYSAAQIIDNPILAASSALDLYSVEYTVKINLGLLTVETNPGIIRDLYAQNASGTYTMVHEEVYNGTVRNQLQEKPDIGNVIVTPNTIAHTLGTALNHTSINLTNIPIN